MSGVYTNPIDSRNEKILESMIEGTEYTAPPQSRIEELLLNLKESSEKAMAHSGLRFKNLGSSFTEDQKIAIANGNFSDLWTGDYWEDETQHIKWVIVDNTNFMKNRGTGTTGGNFEDNHLIVMPEKCITHGSVHSSDSTATGYSGCYYRTFIKAGCLNIFENFFGSKSIKKYYDYLTTGPTGRSAAECDVELPQMSNLVGFNPNDNDGYSNLYNACLSWGRFRLFDLAPYLAIDTATDQWVRDITSNNNWVTLYKSGLVSWLGPTADKGMRPFACIIGEKPE